MRTNRPTGAAAPGSVTSRARRAQIIDATTTVIAHDGLARTSFTRIAATAGLSSPGMISYHFTGKDELFTVLCDTLVADCATTIQTAVTAAPEPLTALAAYLTSFITWQDTHRDGVIALWRLSAGWKAPGRTEAFDETPLIQPLRHILTDGAAGGVLRPTNHDWVTPTVLAAVEGFHEAFKTDPDIDATAFADELVRLFTRGLATPDDQPTTNR